MLLNVNYLYLSMPVLILLDLSYQSRFWTQFEAWLSMQCVHSETGKLEPALTPLRDHEHRRSQGK